MSESLPRTVFFTEAQVQSAVKQITRSILDWLKKRDTKVLNVVSVLEGARPFTRDLTASLHKAMPGIQIKLNEIRIKGTDGHQNLLADREVQEGFLYLDDMRQNAVLVVDDLVDSGLTLEKLKDELIAHGVMEAKTAVLIRKFGEASGPVDFLGFDLNWSQAALAKKGFKDCWLYGYGMDLDGQHRELKRVEGVYIPLADK